MKARRCLERKWKMSQAVWLQTGPVRQPTFLSAARTEPQPCGPCLTSSGNSLDAPADWIGSCVFAGDGGVEQYLSIFKMVDGRRAVRSRSTSYSLQSPNPGDSASEGCILVPEPLPMPEAQRGRGSFLQYLYLKQTKNFDTFVNSTWKLLAMGNFTSSPHQHCCTVFQDLQTRFKNLNIC